MTLHLDTDGVMSAFNDYVFDRFGVRLGTPGGVGDDYFWAMANAEPTFWYDLPVMDGAHDFFERVEVVLSRNKHTFVTEARDVLVDDNSGLVKKWRKAGGLGVLFQSHDQVIGDLRSFGMML